MATLGPFLWSLGLDPSLEFFVFLGRPWALDQTGFEDLGPTVEALDGRAALEVVADVPPGFFAVELDGLLEHSVFEFVPFSHFEFFVAFDYLVVDNRQVGLVNVEFLVVFFVLSL